MEYSQNRPEASSLRALVASCGLLTLSIMPLAVVVAAVCNGGLSTRSLVVAAVGGGVCWLAATLALLATFVGSKAGAPVHGVLLGMLARMGLPLAALIVLPQLNPDLANGGLLPTILCVYLVALVVETLLVVRMVPGRGGDPSSKIQVSI